MNIVKCDINTCSREMGNGISSRKARILNYEYDLCPDCYKALQGFVQRRFNGGRIQTEQLAQVPAYPYDLKTHTTSGSTTQLKFDFDKLIPLADNGGAMVVDDSGPVSAI